MRAPLAPLLLFAATSLAVVSGACVDGASSGGEARGERSVATVNGAAIPAERFENFVSAKLGDLADEPLGDRVRSQLFDEFLKREVTAQAAHRRGLETTVGEAPAEASRTLTAELATDLLVEKYYREVVLQHVEVSPDEVEGYLRAHAQELRRADGYYVRELRVGTREEAERLRAEIAASRIAFADAARACSESATAVRGGLAYYAAGQLPTALERAVSPLDVGQLSDVVSTSYGFHVFRMERKGSARPPGSIRDAAVAELRTRKCERLVEADAERLLAEADIGVDAEGLKFRYEGRFR